MFSQFQVLVANFTLIVSYNLNATGDIEDFTLMYQCPSLLN